jgi:hypothetical protein
MVSDTDLTGLYLSAQRALLGVIGPSVLGVAFYGAANLARMQVFAEDSLSEEEADDFVGAATEIMSDFPQVPVDVSIVRGSAQPLEGWAGRWIFLRRGVGVVPPR